MQVTLLSQYLESGLRPLTCPIFPRLSVFGSGCTKEQAENLRSPDCVHSYPGNQYNKTQLAPQVPTVWLAKPIETVAGSSFPEHLCTRIPWAVTSLFLVSPILIPPANGAHPSPRALI